MKPEELKAFRLNPEPVFQPPWWYWAGWAIVGLAMLGLGWISRI
jgi:hypothetical protein